MKQPRVRDGAATATVSPSAAVTQKAKRAVELRRAGMKQCDIARELRVSDARVSQYLRQEGEPGRCRGPVKGALVDQVRREHVGRLWPRRLAGELTTRAIADELGCSISTVAHDALELGFDVPRGRQPKYPRSESQQCRCGCGETVEPIPALAVKGLGIFVDESHYRRAVDASREVLATNDDWLTIRRVAHELKVERMTVLQYAAQYAARGRQRLELRQLDEVAELRGLFIPEGPYVVHRDDVRHLRSELLKQWREPGSGPPERLLTCYSGAVQGRWKRRRGGCKGAEAGALGAEHGAYGGRPAKATTEQVREVWRLHELELKPYTIAEKVFGDRKFHRRVRSVLGAAAHV